VTHDPDARPAGAAVLIIEDDEAVRELVALHLGRAGFTPVEAVDATEGWRRLPQADLVVLDRMLPDESGDAFLRRLRADPGLSRLPVLMLTARASEVDRVGGLEAGADDYLVKPFSAPELVARLRALLRRAPARRRARVGDLVVDLEGARVRKAGHDVELTRREFELIAFLAAHPGRVFARGELLDRVWGEDFLGTERTVDQHVAQLRQRLGEGVIETVRGRGYRLVDADAGP
jgi:DNA-binding response OmpR family regulator